MKTRDNRIIYIPQHKDGYFIDIYAQPVEDFMDAAKFYFSEDDVERFLLSRFGPKTPWDFRTARIKITYELEVANDVDTESTAEGN